VRRSRRVAGGKVERVLCAAVTVVFPQCNIVETGLPGQVEVNSTGPAVLTGTKRQVRPSPRRARVISPVARM